jgi:hypothetical protein
VRRAAALALAVAAFAMGCGEKEKSESDKVKGALQGYYDAIADGDVEKACQEVTGALVADCPRNAEKIARDRDGARNLADNTKLIFEDLDAVIRGDLACIAVDKVSFDFQKVGGEWRILHFTRDLTDPKNCAKGLAK